MNVKAQSRKGIPASCWKTFIARIYLRRTNIANIANTAIIAMIYLRRTNIAAKLPTKPTVATDGRHTWRRSVCSKMSLLMLLECI